jgi:hypothetical protein
VESKNLKTVHLLPDLLRMTESRDMTLFTIAGEHLVPRNSSRPEAGVRMVVVLKRKIQTEMLTTFLPSVLFIAISYMTTFFKDSYFEAALSVNLTIMLLIATVFTAKIQELPPTSDTKMIDIWLILCLLYSFLEVVLITIKENLRTDEDTEEPKFDRPVAASPQAVSPPLDPLLPEDRGRCWACCQACCNRIGRLNGMYTVKLLGR